MPAGSTGIDQLKSDSFGLYASGWLETYSRPSGSVSWTLTLIASELPVFLT